MSALRCADSLSGRDVSAEALRTISVHPGAGGDDGERPRRKHNSLQDIRLRDSFPWRSVEHGTCMRTRSEHRVADAPPPGPTQA